MFVSQKENLRIRVRTDLQNWLTEFSEERGISKQATLERLLSWFRIQDELAQAMILGQVRASDDLLEATLRRLATKPPASDNIEVLPKIPKQKRYRDDGRAREAG